MERAARIEQEPEEGEEWKDGEGCWEEGEGEEEEEEEEGAGRQREIPGQLEMRGWEGQGKEEYGR